MDGIWIMMLTGLLTCVAGILLMIRENRMFSKSMVTHATVVSYDEYQNTGSQVGNRAMYTMNVEYDLPDGTLVRAKEQSGSSRRKYPVGQDIQIVYSGEKTDMFVVKGDHSRRIAFIGMIVVGAVMCIGPFFLPPA